ncbi:metal-dependent transcriptional regulator [Halobellus salinisoli]|uniref:metal-dependent transcriptional regulator n=1 Tax=Halobellus salinisoli TaxID=3108500 RepID=UPI0030088CE5
MLSDSMEDYLKAIYILQTETDRTVSTSDLAAYIGVQPPTATSMIKKLADHSLVEHEPYHGVQLTKTGEPIALEVIRHHRLLERYLAEHLEYDWSEVHEEADRLEHHISDQFAERLTEILDEPTTDPHGDPIPGPELTVPDMDQSRRLVEYAVGDRVLVTRVSDQDKETLSYLSKTGINPGTQATIIEIAPFGMITLQLNDHTEFVSFPKEVARSIRVRPVREETV